MIFVIDVVRCVPIENSSTSAELDSTSSIGLDTDPISNTISSPSAPALGLLNMFPLISQKPLLLSVQQTPEQQLPSLHANQQLQPLSIHASPQIQNSKQKFFSIQHPSMSLQLQPPPPPPPTFATKAAKQINIQMGIDFTKQSRAQSPAEVREKPKAIARASSVRLNHHVNNLTKTSTEIVPDYVKIIESNTDEKEELELPYIIWDSGRKSGRVPVPSQEFFHIGSGVDNSIRISSPSPETVAFKHVCLYYHAERSTLELSKFGTADCLPLYIITSHTSGIDTTRNLCCVDENKAFLLKDGDRIQIGKGKNNFLRVDLSRVVKRNSIASNSSADDPSTSSMGKTLNLAYICWTEKGNEKKIPVPPKTVINVGSGKQSDIILKGSCVSSKSHVKFSIDNDGDLVFEAIPTGFDTTLISPGSSSLQCRDNGVLQRKLMDGDKIKVGELSKNILRVDLSNMLNTPKKRLSNQKGGSSEKKQKV